MVSGRSRKVRCRAGGQSDFGNDGSSRWVMCSGLTSLPSPHLSSPKNSFWVEREEENN